MSQLTIHLLGAPRIEYSGQPVDLDTRKAVALLAYLVITGEQHTRDALAAFLWPEYDQRRSRAALRRTLSTLKTAVEGYGLIIERESLAIDREANIAVDLHLFHDLLDSCQEHGHVPGATCPACLPPLTQAIDLYRGDFMEGFSLRDSVAFDEWQYLQGEAGRRDLASALRDIIACHRKEGHYEQAIDYAHRLLELDPLREEAHRELMRLYALAGRRSAALRQYRECVRILEEELGVPPLEETTALYKQILQGELADGVKGTAVWDQPEVNGSFPYSAPPPLHPLPLVGRSAEWDDLVGWYAAAQEGGRLLILEGEAGIGKTRLANAFVEMVRAEGAAVITAQCYEGETRLAYAPFAEGIGAAVRAAARREWSESLPNPWLAEASRLLPELTAGRPEFPSLPPLDNPAAQRRFFEAIRRLLLVLIGSSPPGVLLLDNLHWADEASLETLSYLVRRLKDDPLFILATWRGELVSAGHRLRQLVAGAGREGVARLVALDRLDEAAVYELVQAADGSGEDQEALARRLYRETEGLPFFLVEYLAMLESPGAGGGRDVGQSGEEATLPMPATVRDLIRSRLAPVGETGRQLLHTAAVIGRSFDFATLQEASGRSEEEAIAALEELLTLGLVIERPGDSPAAPGDTSRGKGTAPWLPGEPVYDFSHERLRALVYEEPSLARRRLLHRRVARAMVRSRPLMPPAAQIAIHFQRAGMEKEAAFHYELAGDQARDLFANAEALAHYRSALTLGHANPARLHEALGDLHTLRGEYDQALANYQTAAALIDPLSNPETSARLETKLGGVFHRRGDWSLADGHYQQALNQIDEAVQKARLLTDWSRTAHHGGDSHRALALAEEALELARQAGDRQALAQAHNILGILANSRGELDLAREHLEQSLALAQEVGRFGPRIAALNNLSLAYRAAGEIGKAVDLVRQALDLCVELGDRHREAALRNNLADLLHAAGDSEASMAQLKQAVAIYAGIDGDASQWRPEIWKLTEW